MRVEFPPADKLSENSCSHNNYLVRDGFWVGLNVGSCQKVSFCIGVDFVSFSNWDEATHLVVSVPPLIGTRALQG